MGINAAINQNVAAVIPRKGLLGPFVYCAFQHMYDPIREYGRGANQSALNCEQVADLKIPLPPLQEQEAIVAHLNAVCMREAIVRQRIAESVTLLREYRTAIISAAVTGKIDVRKEVA